MDICHVGIFYYCDNVKLSQCRYLITGNNGTRHAACGASDPFAIEPRSSTSRSRISIEDASCILGYDSRDIHDIPIVISAQRCRLRASTDAPATRGMREAPDYSATASLEIRMNGGKGWQRGKPGVGLSDGCRVTVANYLHKQISTGANPTCRQRHGSSIYAE